MDVDSRKKGVLLVKEEVISQVDADNRASYECSIWITEIMASMLLVEMCNPKKVTKNYLTVTYGIYAMKNTTAEK